MLRCEVFNNALLPSAGNNKARQVLAGFEALFCFFSQTFLSPVFCGLSVLQLLQH